MISDTLTVSGIFVNAKSSNCADRFATIDVADDLSCDLSDVVVADDEALLLDKLKSSSFFDDVDVVEEATPPVVTEFDVVLVDGVHVDFDVEESMLFRS